MGLVMNVYRDSCIPITQFGGASMSGEFTNFQRQENWHCINCGEASIPNTTSIPYGVRNPVVWRMALKGGAMVSRNKVNGSGACTGAATYGIAIIATLTGQGTISSALGNLGIAILSTITGSGGISDATGTLLSQISAYISGGGNISSAEILAYLNALADITGTGEISECDLTGIGELLTVLEGEGLMTGTITGTGELTSTIRSYGTLTPEGLRDAIWQAAAASYEDPQTMGGKLNNAGAAANPWDVIIGDMTAGETIESILKLTGNKVTKSGNIITIYESDGVTVWKEFDLTGGGRTEV